MTIPAILGIYKEGPDTQDPAAAKDRWSPWRIETSSPKQVWQDLRPFLDRVIERKHNFNVYVYYGDGLKVEYVFQVDAIHITDELASAPGPTFEYAENARAHVWIHYCGLEKLAKPIARDSFSELRIEGDKLSEPINPITQPTWFKSSRTGLVLIADPRRKS